MKYLPHLLLGISTLLGGCARPERAVVTVNGTPVYEKQIIEEADQRINAEAARSASMGLIYDESERPVTREAIRDNVLHSLIERLLIADQLKAEGLTVTDSEVEARFAKKIADLGQTPAQAAEEIKRQGKTLAEVKERIRWNTLGIEKLYAAHATNKKELGEEDARRIYDAAPAEFFQQEERRVSRILVNAPPDLPATARQKARAKAEDLLKRIKEGSDFGEVAEKAGSDDTATKSQGGDRGWSPRGFVTAEGNDPFGDAAFALKKVGDITEVVESLDGFEIIKLTGIREARQKTFAEVKDFILERERHWAIGNFWEQFAAGMRDKAKIVWSETEATRRAEKEKRDREYNAKIEQELARQQQQQKEPAEKPQASSPTTVRDGAAGTSNAL